MCAFLSGAFNVIKIFSSYLEILEYYVIAITPVTTVTQQTEATPAAPRIPVPSRRPVSTRETAHQQDSQIPIFAQYREGPQSPHQQHLGQVCVCVLAWHTAGGRLIR